MMEKRHIQSTFGFLLVCLSPISVVYAQSAAIVPAKIQASTPQPADYGAPIGLDDAFGIIKAGIQKSKAAGLRQSFAVVEPSGELVAFARMDGVSYGSIHAAQLKARTSARYRVTTAVREGQLQAGRLAILSNDEVIAIGGGVPIVRDGHIVGAVGVSGGSADQDAAVAAAIAADR